MTYYAVAEHLAHWAWANWMVRKWKKRLRVDVGRIYSIGAATLEASGLHY